MVGLWRNAEASWLFGRRTHLQATQGYLPKAGMSSSSSALQSNMV